MRAPLSNIGVMSPVSNARVLESLLDRLPHKPPPTSCPISRTEQRGGDKRWCRLRCRGLRAPLARSSSSPPPSPRLGSAACTRSPPAALTATPSSASARSRVTTRSAICSTVSPLPLRRPLPPLPRTSRSATKYRPRALPAPRLAASSSPSHGIAVPWLGLHPLRAAEVDPGQCSASTKPSSSSIPCSRPPSSPTATTAGRFGAPGGLLPLSSRVSSPSIDPAANAGTQYRTEDQRGAGSASANCCQALESPLEASPLCSPTGRSCSATISYCCQPPGSAARLPNLRVADFLFICKPSSHKTLYKQLPNRRIWSRARTGSATRNQRQLRSSPIATSGETTCTLRAG